MSPDLSAIFALRLSTGRKLMLIAMIHAADEHGWYFGHASALARTVQMNVPNATESLRQLEIRKLIHPSPDNKPGTALRGWRVDLKLTIGRKEIADGVALDR